MPKLRKVSGDKVVKILCNKMGFSISENLEVMLDFQK
jgi:hypothetical protein